MLMLMLMPRRAGEEEDEKERFLRVMTFYLSGWHIKPKGSVISHFRIDLMLKLLIA